MPRAPGRRCRARSGSPPSGPGGQRDGPAPGRGPGRAYPRSRPGRSGPEPARSLFDLFQLPASPGRAKSLDGRTTSVGCRQGGQPGVRTCSCGQWRRPEHGFGVSPLPDSGADPHGSLAGGEGGIAHNQLVAQHFGCRGGGLRRGSLGRTGPGSGHRQPRLDLVRRDGGRRPGPGVRNAGGPCPGTADLEGDAC